MISQEEMASTADRLGDALAAAAAIMTPEQAYAPGRPVPARPASGTPRLPSGLRLGRLRGWLIPLGAAASVTAVIMASLALSSHPGVTPAPAVAGAGPGLTSLAGVPSDPGARTSPPRFYLTIVNTGIFRDGRDLLTAQVHRTSDGHVTGTMPALPTGWYLRSGVSVSADDRTFFVTAGTDTECAPPTPTRFYRFTVTATGRVSGLRIVGKPVIGDMVSQFSVSPDGTKVAYTNQSCPEEPPGPSDAGVIKVMDLASGTVRSWRSTVSAAVPTRVTTQIGAMSWTADGRTLVADYNWQLVNGTAAGLVYGTRTETPDLAVLALDTASAGGSLQSHSRLLFSEGGCDICVYQALISPDGSTLTAVARQILPRSAGQPATPASYRQWVVRLSAATGQPAGILFGSVHAGAGLAPVLSADGQGEHWMLESGQQFGWISGGKLVPLPPKASTPLLAAGW